jgi:rare lipoprotein A
MYGRTAAHKTWPMNTMVKVTNLRNGKSTIVRINDRGPFVRGRIIDCSYIAGKEIGLDRTGIARVKLKVLGFNGKIYTPDTTKKLPKSEQRVMLTNFGIQVGAFRRLAGAEIYKIRHASLDGRHRPIIKHMHDDEGIPLYRVWLMGFVSEDEAWDFIREHRLREAIIVRE